MLSRTVALPVIVAAAAHKGNRLRRKGLPPGQRAGFVAGTATSFASTLASQALIRLVERDSALWPYAAYRASLASVVLARLLRRSRRNARARKAGYLQPDGFATGVKSGDGNGAPSWARQTSADPEG
jgi:hypothetical protein